MATILSLLSYRFSESTSEKIVEIASQEIRSNVQIQDHDLSQLLANRLQSITILVQSIADSPAVQNNDYQRATGIINHRQNYTSDLTDFYMWLDKDGKIVWISNLNSTEYKKYKGFDLSYRSYFTEPRDKLGAYYSSLIESNDQVPRLYISYPILGRQDAQYNSTNSVSTTNMDNFKGVAVAGMRGTTVGKILKDQLLPRFNSTIGLLDNKGIILYTSNESFIGKSIFGSDVQSALSSMVTASSNEELNQLLINSIKGNSSGLEDIYLQGVLNTIAFEPVTLNGTHFLNLFISAPHNLASHVAAAIEEQKNLNALIVIVIAAAALGGAITVLTWNKKLEQTVRARTEELREANKELVLANEQLKYHDDMQREFINVAAHELRTPIQPILSTAEILRSEIKDKKQIQSLEVQIKNAKRLQRLSQDLLDVAMIEGRSLKLDKKTVDLNSLIAQVIEDQKQQVLTSNNTVELDFASDENRQSGSGVRKEKQFLVQADAERLAQVIYNLVNNAIKFTQNGTISILTSVKSGSGSGVKRSEVIVQIKDSGEGIDQEIQSRLFSKFTTRSPQGTGLGLYISKKIIEYHGGKIWAENNKGELGASFYFSLPIIDMDGKDKRPTKNEY